MTGNRLRLAAGALAAVLCAVPRASAQTAPPLGNARSFAVLAGSTITNTGSTVVTGDLGVSPGTSVTGFPPGVVVAGAVHANDAAAIAAQTDLFVAETNLAGQPCSFNLTGQDLGGMTLTPAVYCFNSSAQLTGALTLDAQGDPNAVFIFQIATSLTTASGSSVVVVSPGSACNVFWQVGSSATLGSGTSFIGTIVARASITATTGASVAGRALARGGAVTLDTSSVTVTCPSISPPGCGALTMAPPTLPAGRVGVAYNQTLSASGGTGAFTFAVTAGALPAGITLTSAGLIAGTPTTAGNYTVTIRATDANGCFVEQSYTIVIAAAPPVPPICPPITLSPATLPDGQAGVAYSQTLTGGGGTGPYVFGMTAGALPAGITLTSAGLIAGTPTTTGAFSFTVRATDALGCFVERAYTMSIPIPVPALPNAFVVLLALGLFGFGYLRLRHARPAR